MLARNHVGRIGGFYHLRWRAGAEMPAVGSAAAYAVGVLLARLT
ncbi:MAG TPA: hypothetical protein VFR81_05145 [Longimicrobium sp.]|nr:hypothetical protein [Longimicrobium sp.]